MLKSDESPEGRRPRAGGASKKLASNDTEPNSGLEPAKEIPPSERRVKRVAVSIRRGRLVFVSVPLAAATDSLEA